MVPQLLQAISKDAFEGEEPVGDLPDWSARVAAAVNWSAVVAEMAWNEFSSAWEDSCFVTELLVANFDTRLLKAGQPLHPSPPPAPLQLPPPGHEPGVCSGIRYGVGDAFDGCQTAACADGEALTLLRGISFGVMDNPGFLNLVGLGTFRVF